MCKAVNTKVMNSSHRRTEAGERIRQLRQTQRLTQAEVAESIGVSTSLYSKMESGFRGVSSGVLDGVCKVFHVSADYILYGKGATSPNDEQVPGSPSVVREDPAAYGSIDSAVKYIAQQINMPEHYLWDSVKNLVDRKGGETLQGTWEILEGGRASRIDRVSMHRHEVKNENKRFDPVVTFHNGPICRILGFCPYKYGCCDRSLCCHACAVRSICYQRNIEDA